MRFISFIFLLPVLLMAGPNDLTISQRNPTDTGSLVRVLPSPSVPAMVFYNPSTTLPDYIVLDGSFTYTSSGGVNTIAVDGTRYATAAQGALANTAIQGISPGTVTGLSPGTTPTLTFSGTPTSPTMNLGIPAGSTGATGATGSTGSTGSAGSAATVTVGTVTALSPGASPTVANGGTSSAAVFNFGLPAAPSARSFSSPSFSSVTTATQLSTTRDSFVCYTFNATVTISLLAGQSVTATLQYADNSGMSTNVVTLLPATTNNSGVLGLTQVNSLLVTGYIPANKYRKVTFAVTGGATAPTTLAGGQEVLE